MRRDGLLFPRAIGSRGRFCAGLAALMIVLSLWTVPASAQQAAAPAAKPETVSADELQRLVNSLENEQDRARLIQQLRALIAAERKSDPAQEPAQAQQLSFFGRLPGELDAISDEILATASAVVDAPRLIGWIEEQASDAAARGRWLEVLWHLALVFGLAVLAEVVVRAILARPRAALGNRSSARGLVRVALRLLRTVIELLPLLAFAAVAYSVLPMTQPRIETRLVAEVIIRASVFARMVLAISRGLLLSSSAPLALFGAGEETRTYLYIWTRRFVAWMVYGYAVAEGTWWLGVPGGIYTTLLKTVGLVLAALAIIFVLQNRQSLGGFIRGKPAGPEEAASGGGWQVLRHRLADTWHVLAIVYIVGIYAVYALQIPGGFAFLLRATVLSVVLVLGAGILVRIVSSLAERGFAIHSDLKKRFPTLENRANRYVPVLSAVASAVIYLFAGLALLEAWGANILGWFDSALGRQVTGSAVSIGTVIAIAIVVWELFSSAIERYLAGLEAEGAAPARRARARTLLPLLRTAMMVLIVVMVALIVLSAIGVNIAPLLAGAGIVGIAIGFGAQALVKDIITGLFILIEDTLAVGDVVDVGSGHAGVVEGISIRCLKLRDAAGTVHTVPFSDVTAVKNLTRDFAFYVVDVAVAYREDTDRVVAVLKSAADALKADPAFGPFILAPLEVIGLDRFEQSAAVIQVRLKTLPSRQWSVGREFNRRFKKAFDAAGIEIPFPHRMVYFGEDRRGAPAPLKPEAKPS
jgi:small-conductance mechanosensitive channel